MPRRPALVLFDGRCALCDGAVTLLIALDRRGRLRFAPLESPIARRLLAAAGLAAGIDSMVVIRGGRALTRSAAAIAIGAAAGGALGWLVGIQLLPRPLGDRLYDLVARHRHAWFGRRAACRLPTPGERRRFIPG